MVEDLFDFVFRRVVNGDRRRRKRRLRSVWECSWVLVRAKEGDMEDGMDAKRVRECQFVCDRRNLLDNWVWANEPVL